MAAHYSEAEVLQRLTFLPEWSLQQGQLVRQVQLRSFGAAVACIVQLALLAERLDHHPDLDLRWDRVTIFLKTHSAGGITDRDFAFAQEASSLLVAQNAS